MRVLLQYSFDFIITVIAKLVCQVALTSLTIYILVNGRCSSVCEERLIIKVVILVIAETVTKARCLVEEPLVVHYIAYRGLRLSKRNFLRDVTILIAFVFALTQAGLLPAPVSFVLLTQHAPDFVTFSLSLLQFIFSASIVSLFTDTGQRVLLRAIVISSFGKPRIDLSTRVFIVSNFRIELGESACH